MSQTTSYTNLKLISFVSSTCDRNQTHVKSGKPLLYTGLDGKEASEFYNSVISSTGSQQPEKTKPTTRSKKVKNSVPQSSLLCKNPSTLLRFAQEGNLKDLRNCVAAGCDVNSQDSFGWSALMCAAYEGHIDCVKYLLQCKADKSIKSKQGMCAADLAEKSKHFRVFQLLTEETREKIHKGQLPKKDSDSIKFCDSCKVSYKSSEEDHHKSIAHLLSIKTSHGSTYYHIPENNKGYQLMLRSGWNKEKGLGLKADGRKFPIKTVFKKDRSCIGGKKEIAKVTHFAAKDVSSIELNKPKLVKTVREKTLNKWQRKKMELKSRQKEIDFRRQFICDF